MQQDYYGNEGTRGDSPERAGLGDDQGTRVGASKPAGDAPGGATGAGAEANLGNEAAGEQRTREHKSGYGGDGGHPKTSSDHRESGARHVDQGAVGDVRGDEEAGDGIGGSKGNVGA
ncbi:MAG TPA: hypothetical protein VNA89_15470 [Gemmatimonadaceae bacterium]|nr:hypothetical protein [Gemmatimonadaceae bacterium]